MKFLNKSWWDFKGTVNGTQYILRPLWSLLFMLPWIGLTMSAFTVAGTQVYEQYGGGPHKFAYIYPGSGWEASVDFFSAYFLAAGGLGIFLFILGYVASAWLSLSTTNKRLNAITPHQKTFGWFFAILFGKAATFYLTLKNRNING